MAIVSVAGLNTTGVSLANGDTLIVTSLGTLFTETADAVTATTGLATMTVLGAIASAENDAVDLVCTFADINIGAAGFVGSNGDNAFEIDADFLKLRNSGTVQGDTHALLYNATVGSSSAVEIFNTGSVIGDIVSQFGTSPASSFSLFNSGSIAGRDKAIEVVSAGLVTIINSGVIGDSQQTSVVNYIIALSVEGGFVSIENSGIVHGDVDCNSTEVSGSLSFTNTGLVNGSVYGTQNSDEFWLRGGEVTDGVFGNGGNDTYYVDGNRIRISDTSGSSNDSVYSTGSYAADNGIDNIYLGGHDARVGTGNSLNNQINGTEFDNALYGRGGDDTLDGQQGDDLLSGGGGNDVLWIYAEGDKTLKGGVGVDEAIFQYVGNSQLRIDLTAGTVTSHGATSDSHLIQGIEAIWAGYGDDTVVGGLGNESLHGDLGNDRISGGGGADTLTGGQGIDNLTGGAQVDTFVFGNGHAGNGAGNRDVIVDFRLPEFIDLALIDAVTGGSDSAFIFVGTATLAGSAGRLRYEQFVAQNMTIVEGDVNGDGSADFQIELTGLWALTSANFVL